MQQAGLGSAAWGKFVPPDTWLALTDHMGDVADCFAALIAVPLVRVRLEAAMDRPLDAVTAQRLCVLAYLHDLGKLSSAFQAKALDRSIKAGHTVQGFHLLGLPGEAATLPSVRAVYDALNLRDLADWGDSTRGLFLAALAHHGRPVNAQDTVRAGEWLPRGAYDPVTAARRVGEACRARYPLAFGAGPPLPDSPELQHFFAGLVALADQIGSLEGEFPLDRTRQAPVAPEHVLRRLRIDVGDLRAAFAEAPLDALFRWPPHARLRAMQSSLADLPLDVRLAVLESETGSGKTEAAFLRFRRLFAAGLVDGLYFALPTRAAAGQIHRRIDQAARATFGAECVLALPGYLKSGDAEGVALPRWQVEWADDPDAARRSARWAAETPRRFLAAPVAVGTVDQVLLAGLAVKWAHLRAASLSRSYLVVDEVHASDAYMGAILQRVVRDHVGRGGHALLMSATLGAAARARLLGGPRAKADPHEDYPALGYMRGRREQHVAPGGSEREKRVAITAAPLIADAPAIARLALEAAGAGARVLIIRNTVDQVMAVQEAVEALDPQAPLLQVNGVACPHHGRFAAEDRRLLDLAVEQAMGKGAPAAGRIVCASQTVEQSLDIDADILISDLCPIDVLLQRIGRLHRHERSDRPEGYSAPRCLVLVPDVLAPDGALLRFGLGPNREGGGVYPDIAGLEAVRRLIGAGAAWCIPADNRALVEAGTDPVTLDALAAELGPDWVTARGLVTGAQIADRQGAHYNLIDRGHPFDGTARDLFPEDVRILTRLGADRVIVPFPPGTIGPFGTPISQISVPGRWHIEGLADAEGTEWEEEAPAVLVFAAAGLRYGRMGLRRVFLE